MDDPNQPPEAFSKQSIGMMMGGIAGAVLAIRMVFADYGNYVGKGQFPWVTGLGMTLGGCMIGLILAMGSAIVVVMFSSRGVHARPDAATARLSREYMPVTSLDSSGFNSVVENLPRWNPDATL